LLKALKSSIGSHFYKGIYGKNQVSDTIPMGLLLIYIEF